MKTASDRAAGKHPERKMGVAAVRRGTNREIFAGVRQSQADLRGTPRRRVPHRSHRPDQESATGQGRPDSGAPDPGAEAPRAGPEDHRRSVEYRARAGGARPAATRSRRGRMKRQQEARRHQGVRGRPGRAARWRSTIVLRLFVTGTTPRSARAIQNIRALCEEKLQGRYDLEVIDIYQHPGAGQAGADRRYPDAGQETAAPVPQDHRGPVRQGAGAGGTGYCPARRSGQAAEGLAWHLKPGRSARRVIGTFRHASTKPKRPCAHCAAAKWTPSWHRVRTATGSTRSRAPMKPTGSWCRRWRRAP